MYRVTLAALTLRAVGGKALHLSQRFGLRPGTPKSPLEPTFQIIRLQIPVPPGMGIFYLGSKPTLHPLEQSYEIA